MALDMAMLPAEAAASLITPWPTLADARSVAEGLPLSAVEHLTDRIAPGDARFKHRLVPKATYARRKGAQQRLTPEESERVVRLARVWSFAERLFGPGPKPYRFMTHPHWLLEDRTPLDLVLEGEVGAKVVETLMGEALNGVAL